MHAAPCRREVAASICRSRHSRHQRCGGKGRMAISSDQSSIHLKKKARLVEEAAAHQ
jgi:hypothetical protein